MASPGEAAARSVLAEPVGDRIWFAGEALAGGLIQTAGGARRSGEATARQVALRLRGSVSNGLTPGDGPGGLAQRSFMRQAILV